MVDIRARLSDIPELVEGLQRLSDQGVNTDAFRLYAHTRLAAYCEPYVPSASGAGGLMSPVISVDGVVYHQPYAHYQYEGVVYGPNLPVKRGGEVIGWRSPPTKQPTDRMLNYSRDLHPLATHHWDQAMMQARGEDLASELAQYLLHLQHEGANR